MKNLTLNTEKIYCGIDFHKNTSTLCVLYADGREVEPITTIRTSLLVKHLSNKKQWKIGSAPQAHGMEVQHELTNCAKAA